MSLSYILVDCQCKTFRLLDPDEMRCIVHQQQNEII